MKKVNKSKEFIDRTPFEEVFEYYITQNHSKQDCLIYFKTTDRIFRAFLEHYKIKKPGNLVKKLSDNTKLLRYGNQNYNNREKYCQTCLKKFVTTSALANKEIHKKTIDTQRKKYGGTGFENRDAQSRQCLAKKANKALWDKYHADENFAKEYQNSQYETKRKNKTFNTSKKETELYNILCSKFGKEDVMCQYSDNRYPYRCDFYIKSKDLFIELNAHWTHGDHPFDISNNDDLKKLND